MMNKEKYCNKKQYEVSYQINPVLLSTIMLIFKLPLLNTKISKVKLPFLKF